MRCFLRAAGSIGVRSHKNLGGYQNRRQKVFNRGALGLCGGAWHSKNWQNLNWFIYSVSCFTLGG